MSTWDILEQAEITPRGAAGSDRSVRNRPQLVKRLRTYRRVRLALICLMLIAIIAIAFGAVGLSLVHPEWVKGSYLSYLGGATFIALLAMGRGLIKDYSEGELPTWVLEFGTEDQVAEFLDTVMRAHSIARAGKRTAARRRSTT